MTIKNLRWKVLTILGVFVVFFALGVYPILAQRYSLPAPGWLTAKQLKLGLDLKGGVHLVLRVHTDEALQISTDHDRRAAARSAADRRRHRAARSPSPSPTTFRVEGVPQDQGRRVPPRRRRAWPATNYDRNPGAGGAYDFTMKPNIAKQTCASRRWCRRSETIDRRVNELGVTEPNISALRRRRRSAAGAAAGRVRRRRAPRRSSARRRSSS